MKRIYILVLVFMLQSQSAFGQLTSFGGHVEYRHDYADVLSGNRLSTSTSGNPILSLTTSGYIITPYVASFNLSTDLNATTSNSRTGVLDYDAKQYSWDYYRLFLSALPLAPVRFDVSARAGVQEIGTELRPVYSTFTRTKRDEQTFSAYTRRVNWLPTMQLSYRQTHTYAIAGAPTDVVDRRYSFVLSSAEGASSINLVGSMADIEDRALTTRSKIYDLSAEAVKEYSERSRLDLVANYNRFDSYATMSGSASYSNSEIKQLSTSTSIVAHNSSSESYRAFSAGGSQSITFAPEGAFRYSLNIAGRRGREVLYSPGVATKYLTYEYSGLANISHGTTFGGMNLSNGLSATYSRQSIRDVFTRFGAGLSNGLSTRVGEFDVSMRHSISAGQQYNSYRTRSISNVADLYANGRLWQMIMSSTSANLRDDRYTGEGSAYRNFRLLALRQSFRTSYYYLIPFSLELAGTVNWYYTGASGRTYGWSFQFQSGSFFMRGLSFDYRYNRTYDLFYKFEVVNQAMRMTYRWRMVSLELRLSQLNTIDRHREVWFSIIRPF